MRHRTLPFLVSLVGTTVSTIVLLLLVPRLFRSGEHVDVRAIVVAACLGAMFALGMRCWQPTE